MNDSISALHLKRLKDAVTGCDLDNIEKIAEEALASGVKPVEAIQMGLAKGIKEVGERFGKGETYLPELVMAANVMKKGVAVVEPHIPKGTDMGGLGKMVIGTVEGDIHDIGKSLVGTILGTAGFDIIDLGVDVPAERFLENAAKEHVKILGMSALMTTTMVKMPEIVTALASKGLRKRMIVMVGGAPTTKEWAKEIGADAQAGDAVEASELALNLIKSR
jgi:corrinoid protein of di/trimethylamine methyltransferase